MAQLIFTILIFVASLVQAETNMQIGSYFVPPTAEMVEGLSDEEIKLVHEALTYESKIEFSGANPYSSPQFTIVFPVELVGLEHRFEVKRISLTEWEGDSDIFENLECLDLAEEFTCALEFNKSNMTQVSKQSAAVIETPTTLEPIMASLVGLPMHHLASSISKHFEVDPSLAQENILASNISHLTAAQVKTRLSGPGVFINEPLGVFTYKK